LVVVWKESTIDVSSRNSRRSSATGGADPPGRRIRRCGRAVRLKNVQVHANPRRVVCVLCGPDAAHQLDETQPARVGPFRTRAPGPIARCVPAGCVSRRSSRSECIRRSARSESEQSEGRMPGRIRAEPGMQFAPDSGSPCYWRTSSTRVPGLASSQHRVTYICSMECHAVMSGNSSRVIVSVRYIWRQSSRPV